MKYLGTIKFRFRALIAFSIIGYVAIASILVMSAHLVESAKGDRDLIESIQENIFSAESNQNQYFLYRSQHSKIAWEVDNKEFLSLMAKAEQRFSQSDSLKILGELKSDYGANAVIFSRIVANTRNMELAGANLDILHELDKRLLSQLLLKTTLIYQQVIFLQTEGERRLSYAYKLLIYTVLIGAVILLGSLALALHFLGRLLQKRVFILESGARKIAAGQLDLHLESSGEDELAAVARTFNFMAENLQRSSLQLQHEIQQQKITAEELRQAKIRADDSNFAKSQFLTIMSHEIRTPMNGIIGLTSLLAHSELSSEQKSHVAAIGKSADNLLLLINDILDFSKIEAGKLDLEPIDFSLLGFLKTAISLAETFKADKPVTLNLDHTLQLPYKVRADEGRLRQILLNLLSNALKFTEKGSIVLRVSQLIEDDTRIVLRFEVIDSGIGISVDDLPKMFQSFSQADASISRRFGGSGLGLSICRSLIQLMEGRIGVESKLGFGSIFWFELPLEKTTILDQPLMEARVKPIFQVRSLFHEPLKILVAEDNAINQLVVISLLKRLGYGADVVKNGQEAVEAMDQVSYALILMDCLMPVMDGYEATRQIRKKFPHVEGGVIIIALTANAYVEDKELCLAVGMNDFMSKPITLEALASLLEFWEQKRAG